MNAQLLTDLADRLADARADLALTDLAPPPGDDPGGGDPLDGRGSLPGFFTSAQPVDDDHELLAIAAAMLRLRAARDYALARAAETMDRVGLHRPRSPPLIPTTGRPRPPRRLDVPGQDVGSGEPA